VASNGKAAVAGDGQMAARAGGSLDGRCSG
jgi:hypothetical protein